MRKIKIFMIALALISGCNQGNNKETSDRYERLEKQLSELKDKVELNELIGSMSKQDVAYLTPGSQGYSVISYDLGNLTIRIEDAVQYAGGVKVIFKLGNPLAADITGLNGDVEYGEVDEKGLPKGDIKKKSVKFDGELKSGAWAKSTVILEGIELSKFGYVRVKNINHYGIKLRK